jgi:8-oxo-dGTP diphosphatase
VTCTYEYPRPALTVDCVVFGLDDGQLEILLIQRQLEPFQHKWALPGGFVKLEESLDDAARRELAEETGIARMYLEQLYTFGTIDRDPRGRVITVAYYALTNLSDHAIAPATDAENVAWFPVHDVPTLAFDHQAILDTALERLRGKVRHAPIGFELLPRKFTLTQLQRLYETILERELDKRNFRKKILSMGLLVETHELEKDVAHRAARLYKFDKQKYRQLAKKGFSFAI